MDAYKRFAYLLGCYMTVADNEINSLEVDVLESYLSQDGIDDLNRQKQLIFSDSEKKKDISSLLLQLRTMTLTIQQKNEILEFLADIAYADNYLATQEGVLIRQVAQSLNVNPDLILKNAKASSNKRVKSGRLSLTKRGLGNVVNRVSNLVKEGSIYREFFNYFFDELGYSTTIEQITDTALVDLNRVEGIVDEVDKSLRATNRSLKQLKISKKNASKEVRKVAESVAKVSSHFDELIGRSVKEISEMLDKKRRNITYFTIAFMGRTKAGKSTLHKIITQQSNDDIGGGQIRTTRFNRSWCWEKLKVIDTPGIGAPGGSADTEIAKSIIDEADVICYIVTSDSIQETEFDFFKTIKERNKPLYIILNFKSNLVERARLKAFLANPHEWRTCKGQKSIQGHLDRIHDRLDGKYNMDAVEIIPIHLYAAKLGLFDEQSSDDARKLLEGSNLNAFSNSIRKTVKKTGKLKKSLSVIDGTSYQIHQIILSLDSDLRQLKDSHNLLVRKLKSFQDFMNSERGKLIKDIKHYFSDAKNELCNRASVFVEENYDRSDAGSRWEIDDRVKSICENLNSRIQQRLGDYNDTVQNKLEEISEDLQVLDSFFSTSSVSGEGITNVRLGIGIVGAILTAAIPFVLVNLWNPAGWIVAVVSIAVIPVVGLLQSLFQSKSDKISKAKMKMKEQLTSEINKSIEDSSAVFLDKVEKAINKTFESISTLLYTYINGVERILSEVDALCKQNTVREAAINSLISFRLLEYVGKSIPRNIDMLDNQTLALRYPVERDWINQSIHFEYPALLTPSDIEKITKATQMKINN